MILSFCACPSAFLSLPLDVALLPFHLQPFNFLLLQIQVIEDGWEQQGFRAICYSHGPGATLVTTFLVKNKVKERTPPCRTFLNIINLDGALVRTVPHSRGKSHCPSGICWGDGRCVNNGELVCR